MNNNLEILSLMHQVSDFGSYKMEENCPNYRYVHIFRLIKSGTYNQKTLGQRLGMTEPALSMKIKLLEKQGYVSKVRSERDRRNLILMVTDSGLELLARYEHILEENAKKYLSKLNEEELTQLKGLLEKLG